MRTGDITKHKKGHVCDYNNLLSPENLQVKQMVPKARQLSF